MAPRSKYAAATQDADKGKPLYVVSWWEMIPDTSYPQIVTESFEDIRRARARFKEIDAGSEPAATRFEWSESTRTWLSSDMVGQARTPAEAKADARRGLLLLRAVLNHKRGHDTRGAMSAGRLSVPDLSDVGNARGHDHSHGAEQCPVCRRAAADALPAGCVVCDYLCDHGREPVHPGAALVQGQLAGTSEERF